MGKSIVGFGLGSLEVIKLAKETTEKTLKVLEIGPGEGELVPEILQAKHEMSVIGEAHHVDAIVEKYANMGTLKATAGWFPQDLPD